MDTVALTSHLRQFVDAKLDAIIHDMDDRSGIEWVMLIHLLGVRVAIYNPEFALAHPHFVFVNRCSPLCCNMTPTEFRDHVILRGQEAAYDYMEAQSQTRAVPR